MISIVLSSLVNFFLALIPLLILVLIMGKGLHPALWFVPISVVFGILFTLGVSLAVAAGSVFLTDIIETYRLLLIPWMYLTPIFYPLDIVPANFVPFLKLNPMLYLVEYFRTPIYAGVLPDPFTVACAVLVSLLTLIAGWILFDNLQGSFVYYV